ncbi:hypothetical protein D477_001134 [Arthrobacter crystallopoietes BAB-32]|uniref:Uncharacterized protein n=2 Tax=Crystallibacter crystallopoietes TaxID=37928 RepID=N1VCL5_9MICC|nr:hypothetical protein D477_001134 [Arthrobacter crystallopoietes BAB-32]
MWLQAGNILLMVVAAVVLVVGVDQGTAALVASPATPGLGGFGAALMIGGALLVLVLAVVGYRWMARGERFAPLFAVLGWALLWFPLALALAVLAGGHPLAQFGATLVSGVGVVLSLVALGSKKPR